MEAALRRCPSCGAPKAALSSATQHDLHVHAASLPVGTVDHGRTLDYRCPDCDHHFTLLDGRRRGWFVYGIVVGIAACAFGAFLGGHESTIFYVAGGIAGVVSGGFLAHDASTRARTRI